MGVNANGTSYGKNGGDVLIPAYHFRQKIREGDNYGPIKSGHDKLSAHEIGHAFGLQHDFRSRSYIMSYGPEQDRLSKCNADCLSVNPYFNLNTPTEIGTPPTIELTSPTTYPAGSDSVDIQVKVTDLKGIHQVILFVESVGLFRPAGFPEVKAYRKLSGEKEAIVEFEYDGDMPGSIFTSLSTHTSHNIHIAAIDINGDVSDKIFTLVAGPTEQVGDPKENVTIVGGTQEVSSSNSYQTLNLPQYARVRIGQGGAGWNSNGNAAFSPDGQYLAVASSIGIWLYDTVDYQPVVLLDSQYQIDCIAFSPDGKAIVGGRRYDRAQSQVWDIETKRKIATFNPKGGTLSSVAFSPDGKTIASNLILWDVETEQVIIGLRSNDNDASTTSFSHDGSLFASAGRKGIINVWNTSTGEITNTFRHKANVNSIDFSPTENILASGGQDTTVKLWDIDTNTEIHTINNPDSITAVAFSHDGKMLAWAGSGTANLHDNINLWDIATQSFIAVYEEPDIFNIDTIDFSLDGKSFVTVDQFSCSVKVWDVVTGNTIDLEYVDLRPQGRAQISFSPDSTTIATGGFRGVKLWDVNTGENIDNIPTSPRVARQVTFVPNSDTIAYRVSREDFTRLWDVKTKKQIGVIENPHGHWAFSPDGKIMASAAGRIITLWDIRTRQSVGTLEGHLDIVGHVAFSPDGKTLVSDAWMPDEIRLWDITTRQTITTFESDPSIGPFSLAFFSPDGKMLVFSQLNDGVKVWDLARQSMTTIPEDSIMTFLPNSSIMLLRSDSYQHGKKITAWDAKTATLITELKPEIFEDWKKPIFSPDGKTLAITTEDCVTLFDPKVIYDQLPTLAPANTNLDDSLHTELLANYPNPFNPETWIPYRLAQDAKVNLTIFNAEGHTVRNLAVGYKTAGVYETRNKAIYWDGRNDLGEQVTSGVYFYHLKAGNYSATKRMVVLK